MGIGKPWECVELKVATISPISSMTRRSGRRIKVVMVVAGFPTADDAQRGVFNLRASEALSSVVDVTILFLRALVPGRPVRSATTVGALRVFTVAIPQLPMLRAWGRHAVAANILLYRALGWRVARDVIVESDLVHSVDVTIGMIASDWARRGNRHHVTQTIGSDVNTIAPQIPPSVAKRLTQRLDGVACNSAELARRFAVMFPRARNVRVVHRGVDTTVFSPAGGPYGPQGDRSPVRYAYFGGLRRHAFPKHGSDIKGGFTLLRVWKEAETDVPSTTSLLLAGPQADESAIRDWKAGLRHPERVFAVGTVRPSDMPGYLRASDAVIVPSLEEGLPNVCVEAAACGRAVIGSDVGGIPEVIRDGDTGIIVPRGDIAAWTGALVQHATRPESLLEMGRRGRETVLANFDARDYAPKMLNLYTAALDGSIRP